MRNWLLSILAIVTLSFGICYASWTITTGAVALLGYGSHPFLPMGLWDVYGIGMAMALLLFCYGAYAYWLFYTLANMPRLLLTNEPVAVCLWQMPVDKTGYWVVLVAPAKFRSSHLLTPTVR